MSAFLVAFLLVGLVILLALLFGQRDAPRVDAPLHPDVRLAQCVRALDDPAACEAAQRRLLSMGAGAVLPLLRCLEQIDLHPLAYSPTQQAEVEAILANLGPQTLTQTLRFYQRAHRHAPTYPALLRVLGAHAEAALLCVANAGAPFPTGALSLLAARLSPPQLITALRQHDPLWTADGVLRMAAALLPSLPALTRLDASDALASEAPNLWQRLQDLQRQWLPPAPAPPPTPPPDATLDAAIATLDLVGHTYPDPATLDHVTPFLDDPRVQERLIRLIHAGSPLGPWAFSHLARRRVRGLQPLLNTLLRQPLDAAQRLFLKRAVVAYPEPCTQTLSLLSLSDQPLLALQAAEILSTRADDPHTLRLLIKAAHRHRHTPLEPHLLAALLTPPWPTRLAAFRACLACDDPEAQAAALELLGLFGDPADADLITRWLLAASPQSPAWGAALNAFELLTARLPLAALPTPAALAALPDTAARAHLLRRVALAHATLRPLSC